MPDFLDPDHFGTAFHEEMFEEIYWNSSSHFQELVPIKKFLKSASFFNKGTTGYRMEFRSSWQGMERYIWLDDSHEKAIAVSFNQDGQLQSLLMKPFIVYPKTDERYTKNTYSMPIKGNWFVFWGGANEFVNYHYPKKSQRYAYDLVKLRNGFSYQNSPAHNQNFFAFDEEITAPADGKIIKVNDNVKDQTPGEMDPKHPPGNFVIIAHANKEFSLLAHLKKGSITVKQGDLVAQGQTIGRCGNSGNSSEPHVHFQVMDTTDYRKAKSLRIRFADDLEPVQGDTVTDSPSLQTPPKAKYPQTGWKKAIKRIFLQ